MRSLLIATILAVAISSPLIAQTQDRRGAWFELGAGIGILSCEPCDGNPTGAQATFAFGWYPSRSIRLGIEAGVWGGEVLRRSERSTISGMNMALTSMAVVRLSPASLPSLALGGGVGAALADRDFATSPGAGMAFTAGASYAFPLGRRTGGPFVHGLWIRGDEMTSDLLQLGLRINFP